MKKNNFPYLTRAWCLYEMLVIEGGEDFTDDASDSGGATRWGVTEAEARAYGYKGEMKDLPMETALDIGGKRFWDRMGCDWFHEKSPALAWIIYNNGYHAGHTTPLKWLQDFLNAANNLGTYYEDQTVDGKFGPTTRRTLDAYVSQRGANGVTNLLNFMMGKQIVNYEDICARREKDEKWFFGWCNRHQHLQEDILYHQGWRREK